MGTYNSAVITTAGQSLLARAIADNLPFYFTSAKTTEYVVPTGTSAASLTELPNIKQSEEITSATVSGGNQVATSVRFDNTEITLNYSINTIGVYARVGTDTEETLLAVITAITADVMPSYSDTNPVSYVYSINLAISNASNINIVVSPTGTVNVAEFTELKERVDEIIDSGSGLSTDAKMALLNCFEHVAWIDEHGQTYYDTLHDALFPTAVSISATFTPGSHVFYDTDSLDALRPYLVVRATMPDSTVVIVTDYVLTGSMAAGTNTITVRYQGLTDTFEVTTQAVPHITAIYTGEGNVYTDDTLDSLKSDLVVTYYDAFGTETVLSASDYTLSGMLSVGTNIITVNYMTYTDTFTVNAIDLYNTFVWEYKNDGTGNLDIVKTGLFDKTIDGTRYGVFVTESLSSAIRRGVCLGKGVTSALTDVNFHTTTIYPIPVPPTANRVTFSVTPNTYQIIAYLFAYNGAGQTYPYTLTSGPEWKTGQYVIDFQPGQNKVVGMNCRISSNNERFTDTNNPEIRIEFETV